jgi:hypothetical protein
MQDEHEALRSSATQVRGPVLGKSYETPFLAVALSPSVKLFVMQRVLSAQMDTSEKLQHHNLFQIFFVVKDYRVRTIIDGGSCNNLVSADFMAKIG